MPHEGGELVKLGRGIQAFAIPAEQAPDCERMTQAVQPGRRDAVGHGQAEGAGQLAEDRTGRAGMDAVVPVESEQQGIGSGRPAGLAASGLLVDQRGDARPVRDEPAFAELAAAHDEELGDLPRWEVSPFLRPRPSAPLGHHARTAAHDYGGYQ